MTYKFTVQTTHYASEIVSDAMFELGGMGVCINDPMDFDEIDKNGVVWDYITQDDKVGVVTAEGFFDTINPQQIYELLKDKLQFIKQNFPLDTGSLDVTYNKVENVDWLDEWKKYYKPIILDKISIIPSWEQPVGDNYIFIEPGQAFGTGTHESTNMCLRLLQEIDVANKTTADVGCGSGIIGMAAIKLGAESCYFCDLDADALENLKINLQLNGIDKNIKVVHDSLLTNFKGKVDVIVANITADILCMLASQVDCHLNDGGTIIISGIISERAQEVLQCYQNHGFKVISSLAMNDWRAYSLQRK